MTESTKNIIIKERTKVGVIMPDRKTMLEAGRAEEEQEIRNLIERMLTFEDAEDGASEGAALVLREDVPQESLSEKEILQLAPMMKAHCFCIPAGVLTSTDSEGKNHE